MTDVPAIEIENLTVRFGRKTALKGLTERIARGEKVAVTGRSGSGKSTLLRCLMGFLPPDEGVVRVEGEAMKGAAVWRARRRIGYVPQEPELGSGSARDFIERPFQYRANADLRENIERAPALFERFLMSPDLLDEETSGLSGGEKQRVALVSALLLERPIYLMDEPSSALDKESERAVAQYLREQEDLTIVAVLHDPDGFALADRRIELAGGGVAESNHAGADAERNKS